MRIKPYFCSHCGGFKHWFQVKNTEYDGCRCKHCGTKVYSAKAIITKMIINEIKWEEDGNDR